MFKMSVSESYVSVQVENAGTKKATTRRSELETKMDVLQVVSQGIDRPTQIMYKANLSWVALQDNLKSLVKGAFLREESLGSRRRYELTQTGYEILHTFQKVVETMGAVPSVQKQVAF
jgi:predicted transcriptional regulator